MDIGKDCSCFSLKMIFVIRTIIAWCFSLIYWFIVISVYGLSLRSLPDRFVHAAIHLWGKVTLKILQIQVELVNSNTMLDAKPRVVIMNHQSVLDLVAGACICPPSPLAIGKKEVVYIPIINLIWWGLRFIRIDRKHKEKAIASLEKVNDVLVQQSRSLMLAPEGTRTLDGSILPFKKGAFHIAIKNQVPIYPIVCVGAYELMPKSSFFPKPGKIRFYFLPPVSTAGLTTDQIDSLIDRVRSEMVSIYEKLRK